jgi:virginiamycin B lyase
MEKSKVLKWWYTARIFSRIALLFACITLLISSVFASSAFAQEKKIEFREFTLIPNHYKIKMPMTNGLLWRGQEVSYLEYELPIRDSVPAILDIDTEGNVWFVMGGGGFAGITVPPLNYVGKIDLSGKLALYELPTKEALPNGIKVGKNGLVYVTEYLGNQIAVINPKTKTVIEYPLLTQDARPTALDLDSRGNLWFNENLGYKIGRLSSVGVIKEFSIPTPNSRPTGMVIDKNDVVWFAELNGNKIGAYRPNGIFTEYAIPTQQSKPTAMAKDEEGAIWFSERIGNKIGRLFQGTIQEFALPNTNSSPFFLVSSPEQAIWFAQLTGNRIGRLDRKSGTFAEFEVPTKDAATTGLGFDKKNNLWFTMQMKNKICVILLEQ